MDDREKRVLAALAGMAYQYLYRQKDSIQASSAVDAGERAILILAEYGLVEADERGRITGRWTEAGRELLRTSASSAALTSRRREHMDDREKRLLVALAKMAEHWLYRPQYDVLDSDAMDAGEHAIVILAEYGLVEADKRGRILGRWTEAGRELVKTSD